MESRVSAASQSLPAREVSGSRTTARGLHASLEAPLSLALAASLAATAFIANGGLQLGSSTLVEIAWIVLGAVLAAAALLTVGFGARLHGGAALISLAALAALTGLSITWSLHPSDSWIETNRTLAYVAAFGAGIATVRLARERWGAVMVGVLAALSAICIWALATKVAPAWLNPDELYGRLREPYGYWNAVGVTAAMAMPICLWLGTRARGRRAVNALAWPLLGLFIVTMMLSFSRGSIVAAAVGVGLWFAIVPLRLRSLNVLLPSAAVAAAVTAWAFGQSALTDDRIALGDRKHAGGELGLIIGLALILLMGAGIGLQLLAERRPLGERARRKIGILAVAAVASVPLLALGGLALTDRGIGGTFSDRWHDLTTAKAVTPENQPGRLTETASVRSIYWRRALDIWKDHRIAGAGAGSFAQSQLQFRKEPAQGKHAHGYVLQTLADLGLIGLAVSLVALVAWVLAVRKTLWSSLRGPPSGGWTSERTGLATLALVAIVFGVHSLLDWSWFVPAVAITGLFCAGFVAGRGPLQARANATGIPTLEEVRPSLPRGSTLRRRIVVALAVVAGAVVAVPAVAQEWRAQRKGDEALRLAGDGDYARAKAAALRAGDLNPLSVDPYFELGSVKDAAGDKAGALMALQRAVQVEPANAESWRRLGAYYLDPLSDPANALRVLRGAIFLDPMSEQARAEFVSAQRAETLLGDRMAARREPRTNGATTRRGK